MIRRGAIVSGIILLLVALPGSIPALPLGPFEITPQVTVEERYDSNIFLTRSVEQGDFITKGTLNLKVALPIRLTRARSAWKGRDGRGEKPLVKVLVTGGAGFIGSHLVDALLARGDQAIVVDDLSAGRETNLNPAAPLYRIDIRDMAALDQVFVREQPEIVSHHAAQTDVRRSMGDPACDAQVNIIGFVNLLQLCAKYGVRKVLFASTSAVYPEPEFVPSDETHPVRPLSAYGLSKYAGEKYLEFDGEVYGLRFTIFRYGNVYGPRQDPSGEAGVVAIFSQQMLSGIQPTLYRDGHKTRDYIYVDDVVLANLLAMGKSSTWDGVRRSRTSRYSTRFATPSACAWNHDMLRSGLGS